MRRVARVSLAAAVLLLVTGCGLPLTDRARTAGSGQDQPSRVPELKILPPGPQPGATAEEVVRGFLRAMSSPEDDHRVAKQFLVPGTPWDDDAFVEVYVPGSQTVREVPGQPGRYEVNRTATAVIDAEGSYRLTDPARNPPPLPFTVARGEDGELRLSEVPDGLRLNSSDLERSLLPREVFFLGRAEDGDANARLVADRVFLPVTEQPARILVDALLAGPSQPLGGAVESAVPLGTQARVAVDEDDVVTVDLVGDVDELDARDRRRLSAQLVWTLQEYSGVRLLADGRPLEGALVGSLQTVADWDAYDPAGVAPDAPLFYVLDGRLLSLDRQLPDGDATEGRVRVEEAAVAPVGSRLGVISEGRGGREVRIGGLQGALGQPVFARPSLSSLSWGSGERGLWVLEGGTRPIVWLLPEQGEPATVAVAAPPDAGPLTRLEVSRDGARIALVYGADDARRLYVGRVVPTPTGVAVQDVVPVAPDAVGVADVAWESSTSLVVLATSPPATGRLLLRVAVDGSTAEPLPVGQGLSGVPRAVAAAPERPLVVASAPEGQAPSLYRQVDALFEEQADGSLPFYPG